MDRSEPACSCETWCWHFVWADCGLFPGDPVGPTPEEEKRKCVYYLARTEDVRFRPPTPERRGGWIINGKPGWGNSD